MSPKTDYMVLHLDSKKQRGVVSYLQIYAVEISYWSGSWCNCGYACSKSNMLKYSTQYEFYALNHAVSPKNKLF